jgi:hypothetical protein
MLKDPGRDINLHTFTQLTPVPAALVAVAKEDTRSDYLLQWSGFAVTIGSLMASNLQASIYDIVFQHPVAFMYHSYTFTSSLMQLKLCLLFT